MIIIVIFFKHATIKGSDKNIRETLNDIKLIEENIVFDLFHHNKIIVKRSKKY